LSDRMHQLVHALTDKLTEVSGYFQIKDYRKAERAIGDCIKMLEQLHHALDAKEKESVSYKVRPIR
jgi:flagellin-specific chaperone FliS